MTYSVKGDSEFHAPFPVRAFFTVYAIDMANEKLNAAHHRWQQESLADAKVSARQS